MLRRRFVNLVAEKIGGRHTLHRLDVSKHLFYPSAPEAVAANGNGTPTMERLTELPPPVMTFEPDRELLSFVPGLLPLLAPVSPRSGESRILCSSKEGNTVIYDADAQSIKLLHPGISDSENGFIKPIAISIARPGASEEDLYVMSYLPGVGTRSRSFDVLRCGSFSSNRDFDCQRSRQKWQWDALPRPPFRSLVDSHAVLDGGRTICVTADEGQGTYCFDTVECKWSRAARGWALPFDGRAEYIPDLNLWLGFSPDNYYLPCVSDLSSMDEPPILKHIGTDVEVPEEEEWNTHAVNLVNLGQHRFCIARTFQIGDFEGPRPVVQFAVLTGVEMVNDPKAGVSLVNHKAIFYMFIRDRIEWIL